MPAFIGIQEIVLFLFIFGAKRCPGSDGRSGAGCTSSRKA